VVGLKSSLLWYRAAPFVTYFLERCIQKRDSGSPPRRTLFAGLIHPEKFKDAVGQIPQ